MGARTKLNSAHFLGGAIVAALFGALLQSWVAFLVVFAIVTAASLHDGSIRLKPQQSSKI